uniref:Myb-like domain-containing protein n=1 Tax=Rhodosorus marinus TaxID=101924 RepID=A0A7S2ZN52_9RHOD|mmetsp:Transcript_25705/g.101375  ORF Transcript_25705/g.101375 Transcript_25705/m.101375 type:complete len:546 (+) Transcript_25705:75-1712(+)
MGMMRRLHSLDKQAIDGLLAEVHSFEVNGGEDFQSDAFDPKALDDERQQEIDSWPEARRKAWERRSLNLNSYSYRYTDPGEAQRQGPWTDEERELFLKLLKTHSAAEGKWGIFSRNVPGRVGYQCMSFYNQLLSENLIQPEDKNEPSDSGTDPDVGPKKKIRAKGNRGKSISKPARGKGRPKKKSTGAGAKNKKKGPPAKITNVSSVRLNNPVDSDPESSVRSSDESLYAEDFFLSSACLQRIRDMKSEEFARDPEGFVPEKYDIRGPIASPAESKSIDAETDAPTKHSPEEEAYKRESTPDVGLRRVSQISGLINKDALPAEEGISAEIPRFLNEKEPTGGPESNLVEPSPRVVEDRPTSQTPDSALRGAADLKVTWSSPLVPQSDSEAVIRGKWSNSSLIRTTTPTTTTAKEDESNKLPNGQELVPKSPSSTTAKHEESNEQLQDSQDHVGDLDPKISSEGPTESTRIRKCPSNSRRPRTRLPAVTRPQLAREAKFSQRPESTNKRRTGPRTKRICKASKLYAPTQLSHRTPRAPNRSFLSLD